MKGSGRVWLWVRGELGVYGGEGEGGVCEIEGVGYRGGWRVCRGWVGVGKVVL